jgi:hypothetical protein
LLCLTPSAILKPYPVFIRHIVVVIAAMTR